jgi:hypothetical protein
LASTSARELFDRIAAGQDWTKADAHAAAGDPALFRDLVEPLADSFDAKLAAAYVRLFADILEFVDPSLRAADLTDRYERVSQIRPFDAPDPDEVYVLSRVTLGADVAVTSVMLDAALRRFPRASVFLAGSRKSWEMFAGCDRISLLASPYSRSAELNERIAASRALSFPGERAIVIDPDSRQTQLGLVPVAPEARYYFFEGRSRAEPGSLAELASRWTGDVFGVAGRPWIATMESAGQTDITVSLGTGGNDRKRVAGAFERSLMERLSATGRSVLVDTGAGGEEAERVERATAGLPNVRLFRGSFAAFAGSISSSGLYIGYDSAGQHVAAAAGIPVIAVFAGYPNERFVERWRPGAAARLVLAEGRSPEQVSAEVEREIAAATLPRSNQRP